MKESTEHTSSYYAATANWKTDYPQLLGEHHCNVAIVGGGFTGVSAALQLVEHGYTVCIIEANRIGWGGSGRNGGHLGIAMRKDQFVIEKKFGDSCTVMFLL